VCAKKQHHHQRRQLEQSADADADADAENGLNLRKISSKGKTENHQKLKAES
jgi:hypothetical protein